MDDHFFDFLIISLILAGLVLATAVLLFLYSRKVRGFFTICLGKAQEKEDMEVGISPRRTTIRVVKSLPSTRVGPVSPTYIKPPARRVASNPPVVNDQKTPVNIESPSQKFVFIFPKRPTYQLENNGQGTLHSGSTKSSYLPTFIGQQSSRRYSQ